MNIPSKSNSKWQELILSNEIIQFKNLAFQMLLIRTKDRFNNNEINMDTAIYVLYNFCKENISGSKLQQDLNIIFDIENEVKATPNDINGDTFNHEIENQTKTDSEDLNFSSDELVFESKESDSDINIENEREKLTDQLEALKIQFEETKKSNIQKNSKGFFKKLFK